MGKKRPIRRPRVHAPHIPSPGERHNLKWCLKHLARTIERLGSCKVTAVRVRKPSAVADQFRLRLSWPGWYCDYGPWPDDVWVGGAYPIWQMATNSTDVREIARHLLELAVKTREEQLGLPSRTEQANKGAASPRLLRHLAGDHITLCGFAQAPVCAS